MDIVCKFVISVEVFYFFIISIVDGGVDIDFEIVYGVV